MTTNPEEACGQFGEGQASIWGSQAGPAFPSTTLETRPLGSSVPAAEACVGVGEPRLRTGEADRCLLTLRLHHAPAPPLHPGGPTLSK